MKNEDADYVYSQAKKKIKELKDTFGQGKQVSYKDLIILEEHYNDLYSHRKINVVDQH